MITSVNLSSLLKSLRFAPTETLLNRIIICWALQLPVDRWHELIGNPTLADAILDRIIHNAYRFDLTGESMRKQRGVKQPARPITEAE